MKVTALKYQKRDPQRVNIFIDDEYLFSLHVNNIIKNDIRQGKDLSEDEIEKLILTDVEQRIYQRAVEYLMRSPRSSYQMNSYIKRTLLKKEGSWFKRKEMLDIDFIAVNTVNRLEKEKLIDDREYTILFVESRIALKPRSKYKLIGELLERGITKELSEEIVNDLVTDEVSTAKKILQKKYHNDKIEKGEQKKIQFLQRKGFGWDVISQLVSDDIRE